MTDQNDTTEVNNESHESYTGERDAHTPESKTSQQPTDTQQQKTPAEAEAVAKEAKEHGVSVEEFERTRDALAKANKEAQDRRHKLKEWDDLGVDPDKVKQLLQQEEDARRKRMEEEARYNELIEEMQSSTESEKQKITEEYEEKLKTARTAVERHLVDKTIAETLSSEGVKSPKLLSRYMKDYVKTVEDDGEYKTVVLDDDGNIRTKRGGANVTVNDFVNELKGSDEFASVFPAPKVSGTGASNDTSKASSSTAAPTNQKRSKMSLGQKLAYQEKYGMDAYKSLPM